VPLPRPLDELPTDGHERAAPPPTAFATTNRLVILSEAKDLNRLAPSIYQACFAKMPISTTRP
jgi:hypothetical protein